MSYFQNRISSWALSLFDAFEANTQTKMRIAVAAGAMLVTIGMWVVHLTHPEIFQTLVEEDIATRLLVGFVLAPPFVVAFSIGSFICPQAQKPAEDQSGPMSGYFYRERANQKYKILIGAGLIAGLNLVLMLATSGGVD